MNYYNEIDPAAAQWLRELITDGLIPDGHLLAAFSPAELEVWTPEEVTE